jgi:hypothetical protein
MSLSAWFQCTPGVCRRRADCDRLQFSRLQCARCATNGSDKRLVAPIGRLGLEMRVSLSILTACSVSGGSDARRDTCNEGPSGRGAQLRQQRSEGAAIRSAYGTADNHQSFQSPGAIAIHQRSAPHTAGAADRPAQAARSADLTARWNRQARVRGLFSAVSTIIAAPRAGPA